MLNYLTCSSQGKAERKGGLKLPKYQNAFPGKRRIATKREAQSDQITGEEERSKASNAETKMVSDMQQLQT